MSLCENRDLHMNEMGFWRKRNGQEKPGDYPVRLHGRGGGAAVWLAPDGTYAYGAAGEAALAVSYARKETRRQKLRPTWHVLATLPAVICFPVALALLCTLALLLLACLLLNAAGKGARLAWRWIREPCELDEYAAEIEFTLRDIPQGSKDRFRDQLRLLCTEMARASAQADMRDQGEGTRP